MSFSAEWLALREPVDHRSRNVALAEQVRAHFAGKPEVRVTDFGCGTGSNLRATHALLGDRQRWTLVDYDRTLLDEAAKTLVRWADTAQKAGDELVLTKGSRRIDVAFRQVDLNRDLDAALRPTPDLVTASALFDLISENWIKDFALKLAARGCTFYTVLTYDGRDEFAPPHASDHAVVRAFAAHQAGDKGFGPAAGPRGADALASAFRAAGFSVAEGDSPWRLEQADTVLSSELLKGVAHAVGETGQIPATHLKDWLDFRLAALPAPGGLVLTGHRDTLALPV